MLRSTPRATAPARIGAEHPTVRKRSWSAPVSHLRLSPFATQRSRGKAERIETRLASQQSHRRCLTSTPAGRVATKERIEAHPALRGGDSSAREPPLRQARRTAPCSRSLRTSVQEELPPRSEPTQNRMPVHRLLAIWAVNLRSIEAISASTTLRPMRRRGGVNGRSDGGWRTGHAGAQARVRHLFLSPHVTAGCRPAGPTPHATRACFT